MEFGENVLNQYFGGEYVMINLLEEESILSEEMVQLQQAGLSNIARNELSEA